MRNIYTSEGSDELCKEVSIIEQHCIQDLIDGISMENAEFFIQILDKFIDNQVKKIEM